MGGIDDTTEKPGKTGTAGDRGRSVPALTIEWHRDPGRVGEVHLLEQLSAGGHATISRLTPAFSRPGAGEQRPLADTHLSRTSSSLEIVSRGRGQLEILPGETETPAEIHGATLARPVLVTPAEIDRGVVITLARRVVLCLHRAAVPVVQGPRLGLVGASQGIEQVRHAISRVADLDVPVLIRGETGTGKEMVARALVAASRRADKPFVAVNMAAIPATTAAAKPLGYERGAFTGASASRSGYFGEAAGGTLFLDEVGLTPPDVQAMLLRVLESGEVLPLGGGRARRVSVRVIAATDVDLEAGIASRGFSQALFHRLAGFQIALPPLRERRQDIGELLLHFLREELAATGELHKLDPVGLESGQWLSASQVAQLLLGTWPGNVRALRNAVRQIVISSRGLERATIDEAVERLADNPLPAHVHIRDHSLPVGELSTATPTRRTPWEIDPDALLTALRQHRWSPTATAAALGVPRTTLYTLMDRHPSIRKASTIPTAELLGQHQELGGDLDRLAEKLQVSPRGLRLRLAQVFQESRNVAPATRIPD